MGWLLTRTKKTTSRQAATKPAESDGWDRLRTLKGLKWLASALVLIGLVLGWRVGERGLVAYVGQHGRALTAERVELVDAPAWLSPAVQRELRALVSRQVAANPLDRTSLHATLQSLRANPWIDSIDRVERTREAVQVYARFRKPVAIVKLPQRSNRPQHALRRDDLFRLVDASCHVLPSDGLGVGDRPYRGEHLQRIGLPVIVGVAHAAPAPGQVWPGDDLRAGLALVQLLRNEAFARQVVSYDVSGRDSRGRVRLALRTRRGMVRWGLPPGDEQSVEPRASVKMRWLAGFYALKGSIDAGGRVVDVFGPAVIIQPARYESTQRARVTEGADRQQHTRYDHR